MWTLCFYLQGNLRTLAKIDKTWFMSCIVVLLLQLAPIVYNNHDSNRVSFFKQNGINVAATALVAIDFGPIFLLGIVSQC